MLLNSGDIMSGMKTFEVSAKWRIIYDFDGFVLDDLKLFEVSGTVFEPRWG